MPREQSEAAAADEQTAESWETAVEQGKRAFALKRYEEAVEHYATALELITKKFGEDAPETADLYFAYGKALLENAVSQSSVLGKEQEENEVNKASGSSSGGTQNGPVLSFSGDELLEEDPAVDIFEQAAQEVGEEDAVEQDDGGGEDEPEDDFNAAWEVLDLARAIYSKAANDDEARLKLADTYISLGDISLETEKFEQAITDYSEGLKLKEQFLSPSSRQLAEAHYKLSIVFDLTSGRLSDSIKHAEQALASIKHRLTELHATLESGSAPEKVDSVKDVKGKGKGKARFVEPDTVSSLSKSQVESEIKELNELKADLALKIDELKTSPNEAGPTNAVARAEQEMDHELNAGAPKYNGQSTVNDLTSIVKKRKKIAPSEEGPAGLKRKDEADSSTSGKKIETHQDIGSGSKRKAEDDVDSSTSEKKMKTNVTN